MAHLLMQPYTGQEGDNTTMAQSSSPSSPCCFWSCLDVTTSCCPLQADRGETRDRAQLLITNPDMLHRSILPVHSQFSRILAHLKYIVVDEGHAYKYAHLTLQHSSIVWSGKIKQCISACNGSICMLHICINAFHIHVKMYMHV